MYVHSETSRETTDLLKFVFTSLVGGNLPPFRLRKRCQISPKSEARATGITCAVESVQRVS